MRRSATGSGRSCPPRVTCCDWPSPMRSRPRGKAGRAYFSSRTGSTPQPATEGNKPAKLKAIAAALKRCDQVILATDCDREGQLIGQEILEHFGLSRHRPARAVHRPGPQVAASRPSTSSNPTASSPALRGRRRAPAGRPDLQPVADPHGDPDAARPRRQGRHRYRPREDPHAGHRLLARDRDP